MENSITNLPQRVVEQILSSATLSICDVIKFTSTCKQFHAFSWSKEFWKIKLLQRWPTLLEEYQDANRNTEGDDIDWFQEIKKCFDLRRNLMEMLSSMSKKNFQKQAVLEQDLFDFKLDLMDPETKHNSLVLIEELHHFLKDRDANLTHQYYGRKFLRYLNQAFVTGKYHLLMERTTDEQTLDKFLILLSEWFQPELGHLESQCMKALNDIAKQVKQYLRVKNPSHPLVGMPQEVLDEWEIVKLSVNQFQSEELRQVLQCIYDVLFYVLDFKIEEELDLTWEDFYLNKVLENKKGNYIILCCIFESVARRLGVRCDIIKIGYPTFLYWREIYETEEYDDSKSYVINILPAEAIRYFKKKAIIEADNDLPQFIDFRKIDDAMTGKREDMHPMSVVEWILSMMSKKMNKSTPMNQIEWKKALLDLELVLEPMSPEAFGQLVDFYAQHNLDTSGLLKEVESILQENATIMPHPEVQLKEFYAIYNRLQQLRRRKLDMLQNEDREIVPRMRCKERKYAVGNVLFHKDKETYCVVTDWTGNSSLYTAIFCDGETLFIDEEKTRLAKPNEITAIHHDELGIGKFFCKYNGICYIPNEEMSALYPGDIPLLEDLIASYVEKRKGKGKRSTPIA